MASHGAAPAVALPDIDEPQLRDTVAALQQALDSGDRARAGALLDDLTRIRESTLFREMGAITRQLHEALVSLQLDPHIASLCEHDIPDAKVRLDYVLKKTETAAHRTLNAVEAALPLSTSLVARATEIGARWRCLQDRQPDVAEFRWLAHEMDDFLCAVARDSKCLNERLAEVLMAQDFQDLTGQVIRRVLDLVQDVEGHLVELVRLRGPHARTAPSIAGGHTRGEGPQVGPAPAANVVQSQDDVDDLLSSLGF